MLIAAKVSPVALCVWMVAVSPVQGAGDESGEAEEPKDEPGETEAEAPKQQGQTVVSSTRPWRGNRRAPFSLDSATRPGKYRLTRRDLDWRPGTYGDLQRALHRLPGISGDTGNLSAFHLRGGEPYEAWVSLDGIRIQRASHLAGFTSLFDPDLVSSVDVYTGVAPASVRSGLSGAVHVGYIDGPHDRVDGLLDINFLQLSGHVAVDLDEREHGRASVVAGVRYSLLDLYLLAWKATGEIDPEFDTLRYVDAFLRTTIRPSENDRIRLSGLFSTDRMLLDDVNEQTHVGGASFDWQRKTDLTEINAGVTWSLNRAAEPDPGDFVYPNPRRWSETQHRVEGRFGVQRAVSKRVTLRAGIEGAAVHVGGAGTFLRTSSLPTWAPLPLADYGLDEIEMAAGWWRPDVAFYLEADARRIAGPLRLTGGLRVSIAGLGYIDLQPRFTLSAPLPTATVFSASVGVVTQQRLEAEVLHPRFGNPDLAPERAVLADIAVTQALPGTGQLRIAGFAKRYDRLVVSRGEAGAPWTPLQDDIAPYTNDGVGWAAGLEASIEGRIDRFGGSVSYTLMRTERTNGLAVRFQKPIAPSGDQRHGVTASMDVVVGKKRNFRVSLLYLFKSGWPIAELESVAKDDNNWTWRIADVGAGRFPSAHRVNLRLEHTIFRKKVLVRAIAEVNAEPAGTGFVENCDSVRDEEGNPPACAPFGFLPPVRPWLGLKLEW